MKPSPSRHAPQALREQFKQLRLRYSIEHTLYDVSVESDRAIRAGHLSQVAALSELINWALARLVVCNSFDSQHWQTLTHLVRPEAGVTELRRFLGLALSGALGGNPSWRADDRRQHELLARADALARELIAIVGDSRALDISLAELTAVEPSLSPLVERSDELRKQASAQFMEHARNRNREASLSTDGRLAASMQDLAAEYFPPTLTLYLYALRVRIAGNLPAKSQASWEIAGLSSDERDVLQECFGINTEGQQNPRIALDTGGKFGAYPKQRTALRRAVVTALCEEMCPPWCDRTAGHPFSAARFIEALCIAWFGDAPTVKQIDAILSPLRKEQKGIASNSGEWEAADKG